VGGWSSRQQRVSLDACVTEAFARSGNAINHDPRRHRQQPVCGPFLLVPHAAWSVLPSTTIRAGTAATSSAAARHLANCATTTSCMTSRRV